MRILFVTNNYTPYSGGVVSSINSTVAYLRAHGHDVRIVSFQFLDYHDDLDYVTRIPSFYLWRYKKNYFTIPHSYQNIIDEMVRNFTPDIIHTHHPFLLGQAAARSAKKYSVAVVFTHHTQYHAYAHYVGPFASIARRVVRSIVKRFCNRIDHVIAPSNGIKTLLQKDGVKTTITILPSALQKVFLPEKKISMRPYTQKPLKLLYVGRLVKEKNIPFLFEVLQQLTIPFEFLIVGYGAQREWLEYLAYKRYKFLKNQIVFVKKQLPKSLVKIYRNTDLFLFPSTSDTQGLVLAEAMAQARPVIAMDGIGQRDIVKNGRNGFIISDADAMAQKIMHIANDDLLYQQLQQGAFETAHAYDPQIIGDKLVNLYKNLI